MRLKQLLVTKTPAKPLGICVYRKRWTFVNTEVIEKCRRYCPLCRKVVLFDFRRRLFRRNETRERLSIVRWRCEKGHVFRGGHWSQQDLYESNNLTPHFGKPEAVRKPYLGARRALPERPR